MFQEQIRQIVCVLIRLNFLKTKMIDFNLQVKVSRGANFTDGRTDGGRDILCFWTYQETQPCGCVHVRDFIFLMIIF